MALGFLLTPNLSLADGMVFPEIYYPKIEIPSQQALIHHSGGIERLVIETAFLGEGTNFAWVVPLPSAPEVRPVSGIFFAGLRQAFQPQLVHRVNPYWAGVLFFTGLAFLGMRSLRDETGWVRDVPLCLLLAAGAGVTGRHAAFGLVALGLCLCTRLFARSPAIYALLLLVGASFAAIFVHLPNVRGPRLIQTMGGGAEIKEVPAGGVSVISTQQAGIFEITTIRGNSAAAVLEWLRGNGYHAPAEAEVPLRRYVEKGWVFAASKARRAEGNSRLAALHPLVFTFATPSAVYPTSLTAIGARECSIALYVFGNRRATARHFQTERCDRLALGSEGKRGPLWPGLRIADPEVWDLIAGSTVGTKLTGKLTPARMANEVEIRSSFFWKRGRWVYSSSGALMIALNVALPLAVAGWFLAGLSRGGWKVDERWIARWRWRSLALAAAIGLAIFVLLPKVEIEATHQNPEMDEAAALASASTGPAAQPNRRIASPSRLLILSGGYLR